MESKKENMSRNQKLKALKNLGINPYPSFAPKGISISQAINSIDKTIETSGKVFSIREHGKSIFMDLSDDNDKIQIYFKYDDLGEKDFSILKMIDSGDYLHVKGEVFKTHAGEITIRVNSYEILCKTLLPLPDKWYGLKDVETRYRKRYLDMIINEQVRKIFVTRSKIIENLRDYMRQNDFIEVETPILQKIPGGASAKPFVTHYNILKQDMYLRIAPELYLKRLIVGRFEKVFEIGRSFRNEGLSHMHNPEFTTMEFYWAYQNYEGLMKFTEEMISNVINNVTGSMKIIYQGNELDFTPPYPRITFDDLIKKDCGINIYDFPTYEELKKEIISKKIDLDFKDIKVWPKLVDELYKKVSRPKIINPIYVTDHPIVLVPLAKAKEDEPDKSQTFQLVCGGGFELLKAYTEQNDPSEQESRLKEQVRLHEKGWDESELMDTDFIEALKYGLPPTAGWGMGIERFTMLLTDQYSIKEVIPFPTLKDSSGKDK